MAPTLAPLTPIGTTIITAPREVPGSVEDKLPTLSPTPIPIYHPAPYTVAIEPAHGGPYYFGATARDEDGNRWAEKDIALDISLLVRDKLVERGYNVVVLREDDSTLTEFDPRNYRPSLIAEAQARVDRANDARADALVAIHLNGWLDGGRQGTER